MVTIISGANEISTPQGVNETVAALRVKFGQGLNIPAGARAQVNGRPVDDAHVLKANDRLVFAPATAEKG